MVKQFRFGVQIGGSFTPESFVEKAQRAEELGYSTLYFPDHFIDTELAPMVAMAMAAASTKTLRTGALVFDNDYKHPAILAKEIATIDVLSGGRTELGIGAGWMEVDYTALGLPYDRPGVRIERLEEALAVIKGCYGADAFSFSGTHYTMTDYQSIPKPTQAHVPVLIGGGGPRVLKLAGREADIVGINPNLRAGAVAITLEPLALSALAKACVLGLGPLLEGHSVRIADTDADTVAMVDRLAMDRVLTNLVGNAAKYSPDAGDISIRVGEEAGSAVIRVRD